MKSGNVYYLKPRDKNNIHNQPELKENQVKKLLADAINRLDGFVGEVGIEAVLDNISMVQALRITNGLHKLGGVFVTRQKIEDKLRILSQWTDKEILEHAKNCGPSNWILDPIFYCALAEKLQFLSKNRSR